MRKLLILLIILSGCAKTPIYVSKPRSASLALTNINVGSTANDGTGQTIRSAFQTVNTNNDATEAFAVTVPTTTELRSEIADSNEARLAAALELSDYTFLKENADAPGGAMTYEGVVNYVASTGGAGSGGFEYTPFIVGVTTGAPANGDTAVTINQMAGDHITVDRATTGNLAPQWLNETATNIKTGYRFNSSGQIVVRPAWATGDRAIIKAYPTSAVTKDILTGGAVSTLLTGLRAGWKLDEISGTGVNDILGTYNGTTTGTVNASGVFGRAESFVKASAQSASLGTTVGDVGTSDFSIAGRFYMPTLPSAFSGISGNWGDGVYFYSMIYSDNTLVFRMDFGGGNIDVSSNAALSAATWYSYVVTCDRSGNAILYLNGTAQTNVVDISSGVAVSIVNNNTFSVGHIGSALAGYYFGGTIDDVYLWTKVLTQDEVTEFQTATYPW